MENTVNKGGRICLSAILNCLSKTDIKAGAEMQKGMPNVTLEDFNEAGAIALGIFCHSQNQILHKFFLPFGCGIFFAIRISATAEADSPKFGKIQ